MGVEEVYNFLKKKKGFHSAKQIAKALKLNVTSIRKSLNTVTRYEDIVCEYNHLMRKKAYKSAGLKMRKAWVYAHATQIFKKNKEMM